MWVYQMKFFVAKHWKKFKKDILTTNKDVMTNLLLEAALKEVRTQYRQARKDARLHVLTPEDSISGEVIGEITPRVTMEDLRQMIVDALFPGKIEQPTPANVKEQSAPFSLEEQLAPAPINSKETQAHGTSDNSIPGIKFEDSKYLDQNKEHVTECTDTLLAYENKEKPPAQCPEEQLARSTGEEKVVESLKNIVSILHQDQLASQADLQNFKDKKTKQIDDAMQAMKDHPWLSDSRDCLVFKGWQ
ncbi:hypothetical protein F511_38732 [Dorcoceras hygrometricum]|uniref:Uncharacterized protein n=1 Tax=Dorcoceras hygrometricum TaxID=472368 RepID=A0A2Z7C6Y8_9LAMI|nr:hypothetical protein F511_38732 [Dorcoceras hygrometricum]